jgi:zinc D-Ala-D-Ala carboxypeptidase
MITRPLVRAVLAVLLGLGGAAAAVTAGAAPAHADGCYTWSRTLGSGASGADVAELQIRVAGWAGYDVRLGIDGQFGAQTQAAVQSFQRAYGLQADGVAGPATFAKLYDLQDDDCTPLHFTIAEASPNCGKGPAGMPASVRANLIRVLWRAEALRQRLGNHPLSVTSGWRDAACNTESGGAPNSEHLTGEALDLDRNVGWFSFCDVARAARYTGFGTIFGPGYPDHDDHVHVGIRSGHVWSAPNCSGF